MIWFVSDLHYNHANICRGVTKWGKTINGIFYPDVINTRDYASLDEMNKAIVDSINKYVKKDDELYFLGDWSFRGIESIYLFWKQLNCKYNIHFVPGNHDHKFKKDFELPNCKRNGPYSSDIIDGAPIGGDYPDYVISNSLFKEYLPEITSLVYNKQKFILSHYPIEEWEDMDHGSIMVHGHCHHKLDTSDSNMFYRRKDVGWIDRPYSIDEIIEEMKDRKIKKHES
jgi:calcineurin-like phosphoesterase family protein